MQQTTSADESRPAPPTSRRAQVIAICNQKGGVGKTTSTINLAAAMVALGHRVLVVDLDPQGNTTTALALDDIAGSARTPGIAHALDPIEPTPLADVIVPGLWEGCDLAPSPDEGVLADMQMRLQSMAMGGELRLLEALNPSHDDPDNPDQGVLSDYDAVLVDNTPALGRLLVNALIAAHKALIVTNPGRWALDGLDELEATIRLVRRSNPHLEIAGPLVNQRDRRYGSHTAVLGELVERYGASPWTGAESVELSLSPEDADTREPLTEGAVIPSRALVADFAAAGEPVSAHRSREGQAVALRYNWMVHQLMNGGGSR